MDILEAKLERWSHFYGEVAEDQERLSLLLDLAKKHPSLPHDQRTETNRLRACVSAAWLNGSQSSGTWLFQSAADSPLVAGLLNLLCAFYSEASSEEILHFPQDPLERLALLRQLSPTRQNGLRQARQSILGLCTKP